MNGDRLRFLPSPSLPRLERFRRRGGGWLPEGVASVEGAGGTEREMLDALCDGGPWKRAGGGSRWEVCFLKGSIDEACSVLYMV